jgi:RNA polymerase sigma-70 factor (ECF subfamily)
VALTLAEFNHLVSQHAAALYRLAFRMLGDPHEAEDAVQDAFRSAWQGRERYEAARGERAWLTVILRRRVADRWRKRPPPSTLSEAETLDVGVEPPHPAEQQYTDEMQQALDRLPAELRETLLLVVVGELTHQEAADVLGVPLGTVLSRVSRARQRLRQNWLALQKRD